MLLLEFIIFLMLWFWYFIMYVIVFFDRRWVIKRIVGSYRCVIVEEFFEKEFKFVEKMVEV